MTDSNYFDEGLVKEGSTSPSNGIRDYFSWELSGKLFNLEEPGGRYIDVAKSFASDLPYYLTLFIRFVLLVWSIISLVLSYKAMDEENRFIYLGYLTHQALIISILYQLTACIVTFYRESLTQPNADSADELGVLVKIMWALYSLAAPLELVVALLFWVLDYPTYDDMSLTYVLLYTHGILTLLILIDGNFIARIPVRIKQIIFPETFGLLFIIWTVIHALSGLGNGNFEGDTLYAVIDWKYYPGITILYAVVILLLVFPILFGVVWFFSLMSKCCKFDGGRRYLYISPPTAAEGRVY